MARPNILFITRNVPYPTMAGSSQRTANLIDALSQTGDVSLFVIGPPERKPFLENVGYRVAATAEPTAQNQSIIGWALWRLVPNNGNSLWRAFAGVKVDFTPDPGIRKTLMEVLAREHFDLIVGRYLIPTAQSGALELKNPPVVIDVDDVDSKAVAGKIRSPASGPILRNVLKFRLAEVQRYEKNLLGKAAKLWFSNPDDLSLTQGSADIIPNIPYEIPSRQELQHSLTDSKTILLVGSFNHRVNLEGVDLFLRQAWKNIRHVNPDVRFRIVGSHLPDAVKRKWMVIPGVDVIGFAESLRPHYAEAAFSIVPLMDGAGTKIKVLESLAYLRICVVTAHSITGFESLLCDRDSVRIANEFSELPDIISELLSQPQIRHLMEDRGRDIIEKHFTRETLRKDVRKSLRHLLGGTHNV